MLETNPVEKLQFLTSCLEYGKQKWSQTTKFSRFFFKKAVLHRLCAGYMTSGGLLDPGSVQGEAQMGVSVFENFCIMEVGNPGRPRMHN